jgi:hypothetical protein
VRNLFVIKIVDFIKTTGVNMTDDDFLLYSSIVAIGLKTSSLIFLQYPQSGIENIIKIGIFCFQTFWESIKKVFCNWQGELFSYTDV